MWGSFAGSSLCMAWGKCQGRKGKDHSNFFFQLGTVKKEYIYKLWEALEKKTLMCEGRRSSHLVEDPGLAFSVRGGGDA